MKTDIEHITRKKVRRILENKGFGYLDAVNYDSEKEFLTDLFKEAAQILDSKYLELKNNLYFVKNFEDAYGNNYELANIMEDEYTPIMHFIYKVKMGEKIINVTFEIKFSFEISGQEKFIKNLQGYVSYDDYEVKVININ